MPTYLGQKKGKPFQTTSYKQFKRRDDRRIMPPPPPPPPQIPPFGLDPLSMPGEFPIDLGAAITAGQDIWKGLTTPKETLLSDTGLPMTSGGVLDPRLFKQEDRGMTARNVLRSIGRQPGTTPYTDYLEDLLGPANLGLQMLKWTAGGETGAKQGGLAGLTPDLVAALQNLAGGGAGPENVDINAILELAAGGTQKDLSGLFSDEQQALGAMYALNLLRGGPFSARLRHREISNAIQEWADTIDPVADKKRSLAQFLSDRF